jgi:MFS transporter, putative metabolite:H+ symporter
MKTSARSRAGAIHFANPRAFWCGTACVIAGVLLHLPMYWEARTCGFRLAGMPMDTSMTIGMVAIVFGLLCSFYGLYPRQGSGGSVGMVKPLDDAPICAAHFALIFAMAVAVTIDIMKPTSLAFVVPGMTAEYDLRSPLNPSGKTPAAYLALAGITGTVLGSIVWGWLGDRIGRRASILFAGLNFIATSICGTMPSYALNVAMCFLMGIGVGGMLPIAYALLAETIPVRHRGWLMVLVGADVAGAYILTSWLSAELIPLFGWRILWLIGLPTGVLFIALNRWIPESPRFLLMQGRAKEAHDIMLIYGATITVPANPPLPLTAVGKPARWRDLLAPQYMGSTLVVCSLAIASGLVLFGFNLWIPTNLRKLGITDADAMLRNAAMMGFPLTFIVAWMYGFWSSRKTMILFGAATSSALFGFSVLGDGVATNRPLLYVLLVAPICCISAVVATVSVYSAEIYPTAVRARGAGLCAGASKTGGVLIIALVAFGLASPSIRTVSTVGAVSMAVAVVAMLLFGVETRMRPLEDLEKPAQKGMRLTA